MKKIALAIAMATSASFASAQLDFGPGAIEDQQSCVFTGDNGVVTNAACDTASYNFGLAAYNAAEDASNAADDVATSTQAVTDAQIAFDLVVPAQQGASQEALDLAQAETDLVTDNAAKAAADQTLANYQAIAGDVSSAAISYYQAEIVLQDKIAIQDEALIEEGLKAAVLNPLSAEVTTTEGLKAAALSDYVDAVDALEAAIALDPNDPGIAALETEKFTAAQAYSDANSDYVDAVAVEAGPLADYESALNALEAADQELDTANESLANSQTAYTALINKWEENVDSTVDSAEFDLLVAEQQRDAEQIDLEVAETALIAEQDELQAAQDATATQQEIIDAAQIAADEAASAADLAQVEVDNAAPADLAAAEEALLIAQQAQAAADVALLDEVAALIPFDVAEANAQNEVAGAEANVVAAQTVVDASTDVAPFEVSLAQLIADGAPQIDIDAAQALVDGSANVARLAAERDIAIADQAVHSSYLDDAANPAGALMTALVAGDDVAQDVVTAVSSNYDSTVVNANAIDANEGRITTNEANIATNADDIVTNADDIVTNAANIATNVTNIATNEADIATNVTNIATNATAISDETDARVAADDIHTAAIGINASGINDNAVSIGRLSDDLDVVRSGVAATLAVAGMPLAPTEGWGAAIGTGYFDGESAVAAGLTFRSDRYNFKFAVGTSGGETTGSAGVSWGF